MKGVENMQLRSSVDVRRVMELYTPLVYRLAYARTGSHSDAEDICQEVFLTLARKNPEFEQEENRRAWLIRATVNRANSLWRTPWKRRVVLNDDSVKQHAEIPRDPMLADALAELPGEDRMLLQLYYFEGFKTDEIAVMLGKKPGAVRTRLMRARNKLKLKLEEEV